MKFPIPISQWKICDCGEADWEVIEVTTDNIEERVKAMHQLKATRHTRRILREMDEGKFSRKQYLFKLRCKQCGFTWTKFVTDRMLRKASSCEVVIK